MSDSQFSHEAPSTSASNESPFSALFSTHFPSTSTSTLSSLSTLSQALYRYQVDKQVNKELDALQGELRSESRPRIRAVKADFMARTVWGSEEAEQTVSEDKEFINGKENQEDESWEERTDQFSHPTILSDADEQATMSAKVDQDAEEMIRKAMEQARERIEKGVESTRTMEMELWIGQSVSTPSLSLLVSLRAETTCEIDPRWIRSLCGG